MKATGSKEAALEREKGKCTLSFENLTVFVPGVEKTKCCQNGNPISNFCHEYLGIQTLDQEPFYALDSVSGWLETGQMCLVLGGEQLNKSTLLRVLSGRANSEHDEQGGNVLLNGMPIHRSLQGWRRICPYVSASDNSHSAVLTVKETFEFAAKCNSNGMHSKEEINAGVDRMLTALALDNVGDTVVGDDNLRGVSGGQKRRVTLGEMAMDQSCRFLFCENITDGLSSTDSLQILQKLQAACKGERNLGAMVSLMQPSDEMISLFDTVLVLTTQGQTGYFGPVDREALLSVFSSGKETGSEFQAIADIVQDYRTKPKPHDMEGTFVKKYNGSQTGKTVQERLKEIRSNAPSADDRDLSQILPTSKYSSSPLYQFQILFERRVKLILRNSVTWTRIVIAIVFGVIIGSLFSALQRNVLGALGHTGYLFLNCFLVLMLSAAVTIPSMYRDRVTLYKHRSAEFYSGRVAYFAQIITDLPLSLLEGVLLASISYFWVNMRPGAGHFLYFLGILIALECVGQALGRLLCAIFRKQVTANAASSVVILLFGTVGGFMPTYSGIHLIIRWLSWLTPVSYAFEGLMINQFYGLPFDQSFLAVGEGNVGVLEAGGNVWLSAYDLPRIDFASEERIKVFNIFMLFVFALFYDFIGQMLTEKNRSWFFNQTRTPVSFVKESFSMKSPSVSTENVETTTKNQKSGTVTSTEWPQSLIVRNLCYDVPLKAKDSDESHLRLLNSVNARFRRGRMCALMGTSGAGKTTLMDVIAGYKTGGSISGDILIDGCEKDERVWKVTSGYAEQNDILNPYLTALETVRFTANCRLPKEKNRQAVVERVLELMKLTEWKDVVVGREIDGEGLPKHARKRLTIAIQLVSEPKILFLDEPTTGLSQIDARLVVESMTKATQALGLITLATIHQPSKHIWDAFDDVLLLVRGGNVAYMGESGKNSETVMGHFKSVAAISPAPGCNPADYCLDVLSTIDSPAEYSKSELSHKLIASIEKDKEHSRPPPITNLSKANGILSEIGLLTVRQTIVQWRNPSYCFMRIMSSVFSSLYIGILFSGDKTVLSGAVFTIGAIFFLVFVLVIPMQAAVVPLIEDRAVLYRETVSGTYSRLSYGIGQLLSDQVFHILNTLLMWIFFYFLVDFRRSAEEMGYFFLMLYLANWVIQSIGQLFALSTPNEESANGLGGLSVILSVILMGFLITVDAMPKGWEWGYWANLFHYILQGLVTNELQENEYFVSVSGLQDLDPNITAIVGLLGEGDSNIAGNVIASFLSLTLAAGAGGNTGGNLTSLIECTVNSGCFSASRAPATAFTECYVFNGLKSPPCVEEFDTVLASTNVTRAIQCLGVDSTQTPMNPTGNDTSVSTTVPTNAQNDSVESGIASNDTVAPSNVATSVPGSGVSGVFDRQPNNRELQLASKFFSGLLPDFMTDSALDESSNENEKLELVSCLISLILPPDAMQQVVDAAADLTGNIPIVQSIEDGGIDLPGEVILSFFGWAKYERGIGLVAPFKWWYCMGAVAIFLLSIEIFKLVAIRFIVWTNR